MDEYRIDGTKIQFHPGRVAQWVDGRKSWETAKSIYPLYIEVSPVGACNHRCTFCAVDYIGYKSVMLDADVLKERLAEIGSLGVKSIMYAGEGEPLLHKNINRIVMETVDAGIDVAFTTNGVLLDKLHVVDECKWIKVSLNAGSAESYANIHRTKVKDWNTVWINLADAVKRKGNCTIGVQTLLLPENCDEMLRLAMMCRDIGVDYLVIKPYSQHKFSDVKMNIDYNSAIDWNVEQAESVATDSFKVIYRTETVAQAGKEIPYKKCEATPYFWAYLMANGDLYSCSAYLLDQRFNLGNVNTQTFREIWEGDKRHQNWDLMQTLDINECRVNCRQDKSNKFLDQFGKQPHINFI